MTTPPSYGSTPSTPPSGMTPTPRRRRRRHTHAPGASVLSSFSNLANTIIGSGALAFPAAFASMGMIPGIVSCLVSATTAAFGLWLLSRCATVVGVRPGDEGRKASFNEVARLAFGKGWVTRVFDVSGVHEACTDSAARNRNQVLWRVGVLSHHLQGACFLVVWGGRGAASCLCRRTTGGAGGTRPVTHPLATTIMPHGTL